MPDEAAPRTLYFWQDSASIHQAPMIRALAAFPGLQVFVLLARPVDERRTSQGWSTPDYGAASVEFLSSADLSVTLANAREADWNVFSGFAMHAGLGRLLREFLSHPPRSKVAVMTEGWDSRGLRGQLRNLRYRKHGRRFGDRVDLVLTMGERARTQFEAIAPLRGKCVTFGYSVADPPTEAPPTRYARYRIVVVAALIRRKNVLALARATAQLVDLDVELVIVGSGPQTKRLRRHFSRHPEIYAEHVRSLPNAAVFSEIAAADLLALCSHYDGWGAVVNEALMSGTRVLVTPGVGARDLVRSAAQGSVARSTSARDLVLALRQEVTGGKLTSAQRADLSSWARNRISADVMAAYLHDCLSSAAPDAPPWGAS